MTLNDQTNPSTEDTERGKGDHSNLGGWLDSRADRAVSGFFLNAEAIAKALGGFKTASGWTARCPAHDDHKPSLSITETINGKVLLHCFAGCHQDQVIAALKLRGLWAKLGHRQFMSHIPRVAANDKLDRDDAKRSMAALALWRATQVANGTPVEVYLRSRGLLLAPPPSLRFHAGLRHPSGGNWPAMVALVTRGITGEATGIHRTFLKPDGSDKASVIPNRMMLGPCSGGAVRLAPVAEKIMVAEGIETALSAMQVVGIPTWAALSAPGMQSLVLPAEVREVIVLADADNAGEVAAKHCADRWTREGRRVRIARPPRNSDFNDMLMGKATDRGEKSHG